MKHSWTKYFTADRYVAIVIMANAVVLFLLSFKAYKDLMWLAVLDAIFLLYFLLEAIFKVREEGWKQYLASGWNRFDLFIVIMSLPSVLLLFVNSLPNLTVVFLFRIVRVLRFFKFIKFIPNIHELVAGIKRAFKASVFVLLAFFVYSFIISLISCRLFQDISPQLFGDPLRSFYHIFKVFTIEGWYEVPETLIQHGQMGEVASFFTVFYFVVIVVSGGLFGLSIVNAIFVEEMVRDNNDDLEMKVEAMNEKLDHLMHLFAEQQTGKSVEINGQPTLNPPLNSESNSLSEQQN